MRRRRSPGERREIIVNYIRSNPKATHRDIRKHTKLKVGKIFKSLEDGFKLAGIKPPRTFKIKTKEEKRKIIADYIKKNPKAGGQTIAKETKINPSNVFKDIKEAFSLAGVPYPRLIDKRTEEEKRKEIVRLVKENPLITITEITNKVRSQPYNFFDNMEEIYKAAGIEFMGGRKKWRLKKQQQVIDYLKKNPIATQREINKACKTHVQLAFNRGIFEAYEKAGIKFPFERLKIYGIDLKEVRKRARDFEDEIAKKLSGYGKVNRLVKIRRGFADIILERHDKKAVIEVKDYQDKEISISQINQLNRYLEDCNCSLGILICHKKPRKDNFLIKENKIFILDKEELEKIPIIMSGSVV